jgi:aminopeptidase YwaD
MTMAALRRAALVLLSTLLAAGARAQTSPIFPTAWFHAIRDEASGERPLTDFENIITRFSGFAPSKGADEVALYIAARMREYGLSDVGVEGYPSDGKTFFWAFLGEPAWEAEEGTLDLVAPRSERLADFAVDRVVLGRFSASADATAELVDVGSGARAEDYEGKAVEGKIVLVSGNPEEAHRQAVWSRRALGVVAYRIHESPDEALWINNPTLGNRTGVPGLVPWEGPHGEPPGFLFAITQVDGMRLSEMLARGEHLTVRAHVRATTGPGEYKQVSALIPGTDPEAKQVWIKAHTNHRNTGGGNNLTGVGATIEIARVLHRLIEEGVLPRPRRSIRFLWSAEHFGSTYELFEHPERRSRVFTFFSVDMTGFDAEKVDGYFRMYRLPYSRPHFLSDVGQELVEDVGLANSISARTEGFVDPVFAPKGTRNPMYYHVEEFWAPSDHEEMVEGSIGIPAVEFGHPDRFIGTQEDSLDKVDPTQMRRSVLTIADAAYYLASVDAPDVSTLLPVLVERASRRMAGEWGRAMNVLESASGDGLQGDYREALNLLARSRERERASLESAREIDDSPATREAIGSWSARLEEIAAAEESALRSRAAELAAKRGAPLAEPEPTSAELALARFVPKRNEAIRGPVNLFRPEYGSIWIARKTGDPDVLGKVALTRRGRFAAYEALNFVDGRRTLLDIRDEVSAEYGPVPPDEIEQYFRFLERLQVVSLVPASP